MGGRDFPRWHRSATLTRSHLARTPDEVDVAGIGRALEQATPGGVNVGFAPVRRVDGIKLRVWERGVGETLACGSGMVAAAAVGQRLGLSGRDGDDGRSEAVEAVVEFEDETTWLTGPARFVFRGELSRGFGLRC